jgi:hypothetical protein
MTEQSIFTAIHTTAGFHVHEINIFYQTDIEEHFITYEFI